VAATAVVRRFRSLVRFAPELEALFPGRAEPLTLENESGVLWSGGHLRFLQGAGPVTLKLFGQAWAPQKNSGWGTLPGVPLFRVTGEMGTDRDLLGDKIHVELVLGGDLVGRSNYPGASLPDQSIVYFGASARIQTLRLHLYVDDLMAQNWQGAPGYYIQGPRFTYGVTWNFLD
jgi:hypothetical protein